ncbi:hypothetical protein N7373_01570 [Achromobacter mucicolens]|uniref:hypothetical protein n=1 Tax=Achromobacter mucicolens TaxID=1389922 RepID=UPI00244D20B8|nr:hypothetical protein [Achromobacter mucicolens]MDH0090121.1 hypothetical protein [Achromobacter mucicolens]
MTLLHQKSGGLAMVGIRKVQVCDRLVGKLQHPADACPATLGLSLTEKPERATMRLSALPPIFRQITNPVRSEIFFTDPTAIRRKTEATAMTPTLLPIVAKCRLNNIVINKNRRYDRWH